MANEKEFLESIISHLNKDENLKMSPLEMIADIELMILKRLNELNP